eukprot:7759369-Heterocapsa_arctica.AAC.1
MNNVRHELMRPHYARPAWPRGRTTTVQKQPNAQQHRRKRRRLEGSVRNNNGHNKRKTSG